MSIKSATHTATLVAYRGEFGKILLRETPRFFIEVGDAKRRFKKWDGAYELEGEWPWSIIFIEKIDKEVQNER